MSEHVDVLDTPEAGGIVVRGSVVRVAGFACGLLFSLVGVAVLSRHLGVELYGRFQTIASLIMIISAVTDLGMAALGVREYVQRPPSERRALLRALLGMRIVLTSIGVAAATVIVAVGRDWGTAVVAGTAAMGIGLFFLVVQTTLAIPLHAHLRLGTITAIDVARQALTAAGFAVLVVLDAGLFPVLAVTVPVHLVLLAWTARLVSGQVPLRPSFDVRAWGALLKASIAFSLATAVGVTYQYLTQIMTAFIADERTAGLFSASFRVYIVAAAIPGLLLASAFPLLSRAAQDADGARLANAVRGLFQGTIILGCAGALICLLGASAIIEVVNGSKFSPAADALRIQGATLLLTFVLSTWGFTLLALHRHRPMVLTNVASLIVTAAAVAALADPLGEEGAALATVIGELVLATGYLVALARGGRTLLPPVVPAAKVLCATGAGAAAGLLLDAGAVPDTAAGLAIFAALLLALRAVPPDVFALLPQRAR